ncbi:hypothetical protein VTN31DRAFT_5556 [Thermomyces dupontii]|uniref:uncharacterized protein n=1 Tax=Talaromyces thermophilus TaxID=28565 RepID=UPI003743A60E
MNMDGGSVLVAEPADLCGVLLSLRNTNMDELRVHASRTASSGLKGGMEEECRRHDALAAGRGQHKRYDIVGSLPLELVIHVVEYLDEVDIVRSQRVSKRWRAIISCNGVIRSVLPQTPCGIGH